VQELAPENNIDNYNSIFSEIYWRPTIDHLQHASSL
jgi:hypothetical protein